MAHWHCVVAGFSQLHVLSLYSRSTASIAEKECLFSSYDLDLIVQTHTHSGRFALSGPLKWLIVIARTFIVACMIKSNQFIDDILQPGGWILQHILLTI